MLIQFRFKNFKSFRDDTILDMSAMKMTEYSNTVTSIGGEKLLPVAAVYGANASGKSNVIDAFRFMTTYVLNSFGYGGEGTKRVRRTPFEFDSQSRREEMLFEVYFVDTNGTGEKSYNYGFTLGEDSQRVITKLSSTETATHMSLTGLIRQVVNSLRSL